MSGAEKFFDNLLNLMDTEPGLLLTSVRCLPMDSSTRDVISQAIATHAKVKVSKIPQSQFRLINDCSTKTTSVIWLSKFVGRFAFLLS